MTERERYLKIELKKIINDRCKFFERMVQNPAPDELKEHAREQLMLQYEIFSWLNNIT